MPEEVVIFSRTFDLLTWMIPVTDKFLRVQRFVVTKRQTDDVLDFQETLFDANAHRGAEWLAYLRQTDAHLDKVRLYLRLAYQFGWLTVGQYEHVSNMVDEIGRLLGAWIRQGGLYVRLLPLKKRVN